MSSCCLPRLEERFSVPPQVARKPQPAPAQKVVHKETTAPGGALARLMHAGLNGQTAGKRAFDAPPAAPHAPRPAKVPRPTNLLAPGPVAVSAPIDPGRQPVTDEKLLVCVSGADKDDFIPTQSALLVALVDSGIDKTLCQLGGSHIRECIAVNGPGTKCRTWRLVMVNPVQKTHFMRNAFLYEIPLRAAGLEVTDWTWGGKKK
ncbi:hypothetical protein KFL_000480500 [Klebsormidium nitens]|uniref:Uncharacterized protein n=1 Tax=Klebsormidium nitens TaxID=105231 RepID=A0A1Y1HSP8_KLENI|nr:hypothetical protein KFL_000480500 [Klebsormidium nitens]|eukprot:GAQ80209.1 hypothetical protein KFL_000480500 [Klebsormidium nitens]